MINFFKKNQNQCLETCFWPNLGLLTPDKIILNCPLPYGGSMAAIQASSKDPLPRMGLTGCCTQDVFCSVTTATARHFGAR